MFIILINKVILEDILITGSNGFLGSHLSNYMLDKKYKVIGLSTHIDEKSKIKQIRGDVRNISKISGDLSCIVHLAALTDVDYCQSKPMDCFDINVKGTQNMLEMARKTDSKFVFASTSQVFGLPMRLPLSENEEIHPVSIYACSKACGELLCETYSKSYGLDVVIVRSFSIYGPNSPSYLVTTKIIKQLIKGNKITIGNLSPRRDFLYVSDLVSAFELVINKKLKSFSKYNIGYGISISIRDLCNKLITISGKKVSISSRKNLARGNEIQNLVCDNTKIKQLGWQPKISIDQGLLHTFNWFKERSK